MFYTDTKNKFSEDQIFEKFASGSPVDWKT